MPDILWWVAALFAIVGMAMIIAAGKALRRRRPLRMSLRLLLALMFLAVAAASGAIALGVQGYRALTHEEVAAVVHTKPLGLNRFRAQFRFPDGREVAYTLSGDQLYVDARILKWHPLANVLGLHTVYELDRVSGRYLDLTQEQQQPRTVLSLAPERRVDLFNLRQRYALLSPLLDADYGSATFAAADSPTQYEVRVSTTGLLIRKLAP
jgi:4-amino-4-deoxy-L-arabinose transferase-like glycosyltransferase